MNMELLNSLAQAAQKLADQFILKFVTSWLIACELHLSLFTLFGALVLLDLFTRWIAIAKGYLTETGDPSAGLYTCIRTIPAAHRAGWISSSVMRKQFCDKMAMYFIVVLGAIFVDQGLEILHKAPSAVVLCITYLSMTELLSIVENLDEAGVSALHQLTDILRGRRGR